MIEVERGTQTLAEIGHPGDDMAIAAITVAELLVGVELADDQRRAPRVRFVEGVFERLTIESYGLEVARAHARLIAHGRRTARQRGKFDLLIAATAAARDRIVVTTDAAGFADLPGVRVRS
ncbi:MAG: PIN domain-containing protein [Gaiellaceae bacterium MAG52_C11]|nr:PIN domain-containing protein [Candidatus Gaiellasilicea maunaloa]